MTELVQTNPGAGTLAPCNLTEAMRLADMMAKSKLVPQHLQDKPADCLLVIEQASRWQMSPFAVAQATGVIKGRLAFEGKLVAAVINTSGVLAANERLRYEYSGDGKNRQVKVSGLLRGDDSPSDLIVKLQEVETDNPLWKRQTDQQLCYAGSRVWARRFAPEVMLGVYSPEEDFEDQAPKPPKIVVQSGQAPRIELPPPPKAVVGGADTVTGEVVDQVIEPSVQFTFIANNGVRTYPSADAMVEALLPAIAKLKPDVARALREKNAGILAEISQAGWSDHMIKISDALTKAENANG